MKTPRTFSLSTLSAGLVIGAVVVILMVAVTVAWHGVDDLARREKARTFDQSSRVVTVLMKERLREVERALRTMKRRRGLASALAEGRVQRAHAMLAQLMAAPAGRYMDIVAIRDSQGLVARAGGPLADGGPAVAALPGPEGVHDHWHVVTTADDRVVLARGLPVSMPETGRVTHIFYGAVVLNGNFSLAAAMRQATDAAAVGIVRDGRLLAASARAGTPERRRLAAVAEASAGRAVTRGGTVYSAPRPLPLPGGGTAAHVIIALPDVFLQTVRHVFLKEMLIIPAVVLLLGVTGWLLARRFLVGTLGNLMAYADAVAHDRDDVRFRPGRVIEFNRLGRLLEGMVASLKRNERYLDDLINAANAPILVWAPDFSLIRVNPAARNLFNMPRDSLLGRSVLELPGVGSDGGARDALFRATRGETVEGAETRVGGGNGDERVVAWSLAPVMDETGGVLAVVAQGQDITTLRQMVGELSRANRELERMAYVTTHDLQEPLRSISGFAQLVRRRYEGRLDSDADSYLRFMTEAAGRMKAMVQDIMEYALVDAADRSPQPVDVGHEISRAMERLHQAIEETGAVITVDDMPTIEGTPHQIRLVFHHLLSNALKFHHPERRPEVHVGCRRCSNAWAFDVSDNGIGIAPEHQGRLFVLFRRLHTQSAYPGTGVGLAVSRRIVERHGGTIQVESVPDQGTTFRFTVADTVPFRFSEGGGAWDET